MSARHDGSIVLAASFAIAAFAIWGLSTGEKWSALSQIIAARPAEHFEASDWSYHWRLISISNLALGVLGAGAGALIFFGKRFGLLILAASATAKLAYEVTAGVVGFARYTFESPVNISTVFLVAIIAWALYRYLHWPILDHAHAA